MKIGRNQICPLCSSGKKYKKCCGDPRLKNQLSENNSIPTCHPFNIGKNLKRSRAAELIRQQQQGLGKQIIEAKFQGQQLVAVGDTLYHSPNWKTFPDFLSDYFKMVMGEEWGNNEHKK